MSLDFWLNSVFKYSACKRYCNRCRDRTPHRIIEKGSIIIEECLSCKERTYIDIRKLRDFYFSKKIKENKKYGTKNFKHFHKR